MHHNPSHFSRVVSILDNRPVEYKRKFLAQEDVHLQQVESFKSFHFVVRVKTHFSVFCCAFIFHLFIPTSTQIEGKLCFPHVCSYSKNV